MNDTFAPEPPENIINLFPGSETDLEITRRKVESWQQCPGLHKSVEVDSKSRTLKCRHCGFVIDAFDYVNAWAMEGARRMTGLQRIEHVRKIAQAEHDDLVRKIKNMREQLKRGGMPQPPAEKMAFACRKINPHLEGTPHQTATP